MGTINLRNTFFSVTLKHSITGITQSFNTGSKLTRWSQAVEFGTELLALPQYREYYLFSIQRVVKRIL